MSLPGVRAPSPDGTWHLLRALPARLRLAIATMLVFNAGFYAVLPFLAAYLTDDIGLAAGVVGSVIGLRMLLQQGLFVVGGLLADRVGVRRAILAGIALRVASFTVLGLVTAPWALIAAVLLIALAGALFTPALEALVAEEAEALAAAGGPTRTAVFAVYAVGSQVGTVVGPVAGMLLLLGGFRWSCLAAALVFALTFAAHHRLLPRHAPGPESRSAPRPGPGSEPERGLGSERPDWRVPLGNRRFLLFAAGSSGFLAVYNQLYLALPLELGRLGRPTAAAGWLFVASAVLIIVLQVRVTRVVERQLPPYRSIPLGFLLLAAAGLAPVLVPVLVPGLSPGDAGMLGLAGFVVLLTCGEMVLLPSSRDAVAGLAGGRMLATHFGLAGTAGGICVFVTSALVGGAFDLTDRASSSGPVAALPWLLIAATAAASAATTALALRSPRGQANSSGAEGRCGVNVR